MLATAVTRQCKAAACPAATMQQRPSLTLSGRPLQLGAAACRQQHRRVRGSHTTVAVLDITAENYETEVVQSELPVLMDFWAHWCGPCKLVLPSVEWAEKEYDGQIKVVKVEADGNNDLVKNFDVHGLPTLIMVKDGKKLPGSHHEGAITQAKLVAYLERCGFSKSG